ncbi:hypothetical protein [Actinoplanes utahensis]|nr:hypothetical protein [Actinoplanes utahensis]
MERRAFVEWVGTASGKLVDPDRVVSCPEGDGGLIEVAYVEREGELIEARLYCETCGTDTWARKPPRLSDEQRGRVRRV